MEIDKNFVELMRKLNELEAARCILTLAIHKKRIEEVKQKKLANVRSVLEAKIYNYNKKQKADIQPEIDSIMSDYENAIDDVIDAYNTQQLKLQKYLQESEVSQKYAIEDVLRTYSEIEKSSELTEEDKAVIIKKMQKKLNYDAIIEECEARIEKCTNTAIKTLEKTFEESDVKIMKIQKENFITRFFKILKTFFNTTLQEPAAIFSDTKENLELIERKLSKKIKLAKIEIVSFDMQMEKIRAEL